MAGQLNEQQQGQWANDGYLLLKGLLSPLEVKRFAREVDRLYRQHVPRDDRASGKGMDIYFAIEDSEVLMELIDYPPIFDIALELMGPYIQLSMAEVLVRPPNPEAEGYIHTDGGPGLRRIRVSEKSWPLQIKVQYFLTDVAEPHSGNFTLCPGSHLLPFPEVAPGDEHLPTGIETPGAVQLCVAAGDVAVFPHSLWHGAAPNRSRRTRKSLIFGYSQLFLRSFGYDRPSPELLAQCTPRQRRLLGDMGRAWHPGAYFKPPQDQVELMREK